MKISYLSEYKGKNYIKVSDHNKLMEEQAKKIFEDIMCIDTVEIELELLKLRKKWCRFQ